jgi:alpha-tubulin suppressor-like RCC1 family protein
MAAMRLLGGALFVLVGWTACYDAPTGHGPCSITCESECPGDLTCENGFCVGEGEQCAPGFVSISSGGGFSCAIDERSELWCWGSNDRHQIDPSDEHHYAKAHLVAGRKYQQVSAGRGHVCALSDGQMYCWGANDRGQITGSVIGDIAEPTQIVFTGGPAGWKSVAAGFQNTCAIADDGVLFCWGRNDLGQLGNGKTTDSGSPTRVTTELTDWTLVAPGGTQLFGQHTCAVSASEGVFCWGANDYGQLANQNGARAFEPVAVGLMGATSLALGAYHTCAVADGELYCWGYAPLGSLGDPAVIAPGAGIVATPTLASSLAGGWTDVDAGELVTCGVREGEVYCWGHTRTGNGVGGGFYVPGLQGFTKTVAAGAERVSVALNETIDPDGGIYYDLEGGCHLSAGAVRCWGDNRHGQLGQGASAETARPLPIVGEHVWSTLSTGLHHTCGIDDAGTLSCWGSTQAGSVDGTVAGTAAAPCTLFECDPSVPRVVGPAARVAIGTQHTCALQADVVSCWGDNSYFQHGMGVPTPAPSPLPGTFTELFDMHGMSTCARATAGEVSCWGNSSGPQALPELATMTQIQTGGLILGPGYTGAGCFVDAANTLFCLGDNSLGQYGNGSGCVAGNCLTCGNAVCDGGETTALCADCGTGTASNLARQYLTFSAGWDIFNTGSAMCGVKLDGTVECWGRNDGGMISQEIDPNTNLPIGYVVAPVAISGLTGCTQIAVGQSHACAMCNDDVLCWGDHRFGAVGSQLQSSIPVIEPRPIDVDPPAGDRWAQLTSGGFFTCVRSEAGQGFCWGGDQHGALGLGASASTLPVLVLTE